MEKQRQIKKEKKLKKSVDIPLTLLYNNSCVKGNNEKQHDNLIYRGVAQLG